MSQLLSQHPSLVSPKHMIDQIENHVAWIPYANMRTSEKLLAGKKPFTYIFRMGSMNDQYIISFVDKDNLIQHLKVQIKYSERIGWYFQNCTAELRQRIVDLIPFIMRCQSCQCTAINT